MGATKMLTEDMTSMAPEQLMVAGTKRMGNRELRVPTITFPSEPQKKSAGHNADELFFTTAEPAFLDIRSQAARMAGVDLPVMLVGGSANARDGVARLLHKLSPRRDRAFAQVKCGSFSTDALERELFGCEVETPFGTAVAKHGLLEACRGGTVLLDDITSMPARLQARLVDLLDAHHLCRVNGRKWVNVDVRILVSTGVKIEDAVAAGKLRQDLYHRLDSLALCLPTLGEGQAGTVRTLARSTPDFGVEGDATLTAAGSHRARFLKKESPRAKEN